MRLDHLSDSERREYTIAHNRVAELSEWDFEMLEKELDELDFDFGFDSDNDEFSIDEMQEVSGYNAGKDESEYFEKAFTFPRKYKKEITCYLKVHIAEITDDIIEKATKQQDG